MYDYAKCDGQLRSCLTTPFKFELHFTHSSRTVGSLKVRTQGWKRVVGGGKGVTMHKLTHVSNTLSLSSRNIHVSSVCTQKRRRCTTKKKGEGNLFHIHSSNQSSHSPSFPLETCKFLPSSMCPQHRRICTTKKKEEGNLFRIHSSNHPYILLYFL